MTDERTGSNAILESTAASAAERTKNRYETLINGVPQRTDSQNYV